MQLFQLEMGGTLLLDVNFLRLLEPLLSLPKIPCRRFSLLQIACRQAYFDFAAGALPLVSDAQLTGFDVDQLPLKYRP
jgi:hypothetical protein